LRAPDSSSGSWHGFVPACAERAHKRRAPANSHALQVEPERFKLKDEAVIEHHEALHVQQIKDEFFQRLLGLVADE
jgi:hypothetical protein